MQEVMRIGDEFVVADDDIKDIGYASNDIADIARKYKTNILANISKGSKHNLVAKHYEDDTGLADDILKVIAIIDTLAKVYGVDAKEIASTIQKVIECE